MPGDPADAADEVLDQVVVAAVLEVGGGEVPEARGPDARALVHPAPRDRVVGAHRRDARADGVGLLVERHQHVVRAARRSRRTCSARRRSGSCRAGRGSRGGCGRRPGRSRCCWRRSPSGPASARRSRCRPARPTTATSPAPAPIVTDACIAADAAAGAGELLDRRLLGVGEQALAGRVVAVARRRLPEEDRVVLREVGGREDRGVADRRVAAARKRAAPVPGRCRSGSRWRSRRRAAWLWISSTTAGWIASPVPAVAVAGRSGVDQDLRLLRRGDLTP